MEKGLVSTNPLLEKNFDLVESPRINDLGSGNGIVPPNKSELQGNGKPRKILMKESKF